MKKNEQMPEFEGNESKVYELLQGMTTEQMMAMYFDDALIEPNYKLWQLNAHGHRYYYRFNAEGKAEFYPSVTTILSQTMPTPPHLVKWIAEMGYEEAEAYKQERAYYGTFMHAQFEKFLIERYYDLDALKGELLAYMERNKLPDTFIYHADELKKDVLAFAQFVIDYDVKPLAVEISLVSEKNQYAGMIDLPCTMKKSPKKDERITAIVDFKSGRKGFYEEHEIQLHMYKEMWNENFPDQKIDKVFNFSPKDWRKSPTYNLKDQTESPSALKIPYLIELAKFESSSEDKTFTAVSGVVNLNAEAVDLMQNITTMTLAEIVANKAPKTEESEETAE